MKCALIKGNKSPDDWTFFVTNIEFGGWSFGDMRVVSLTGDIKRKRERVIHSSSFQVGNRATFNSNVFLWKIYNDPDECIAENFVWFI